ncbi:MAG TPA: hypothetical protein VF174_05295 [Micromonosporaceae bacterium]
MPISIEQRAANYHKQSGRPYLTPRQRRRLGKKQASLQRRGSSRP